MALTFSCPSCKSVLRVSETMAGKKARCPSCQTVFTLPQSSEAVAPAPIPAPPPPPAPPPIEEAPAAPKASPKASPPIALTPDDEDEEEDAPRSKKPPPLSEKPSRRRGRDDDDEDDEDEDDRPRRRRRPLDDDEDDEDDEDRPRRRRRPKPAGSNTGLWVLGGIGAVVVLLLVCGGGVLLIRNMGGGSKITLVNGAVTINDSLGITDSFDTQRRNCRCRRYQIDMVQGRTYTIDQMSAAIDSYLRLEDPTGARVAEDDDGGGIMGGGVMNLNARIIYVAPRTGTYTIIATSFDPRLGPYTLTVREAQGGGLPVKK